MFAIALVAAGLMVVGSFTSTSITPETHATCVSNYTCGPTSPQVVCADHHIYANICEANEACQYVCCNYPFYCDVNAQGQCLNCKDE